MTDAHPEPDEAALPAVHNDGGYLPLVIDNDDDHFPSLGKMTLEIVRIAVSLLSSFATTSSPPEPDNRAVIPSPPIPFLVLPPPNRPSATKGGGVSTRVGASRFLDEQSSSSLALEHFVNLTALYPRGPLVVGIGYKTDPGDADREPDVSFCGSSCMASQDQKNCKSPTDLHKAPATQPPTQATFREEFTNAREEGGRDQVYKISFAFRFGSFASLHDAWHNCLFAALLDNLSKYVVPEPLIDLAKEACTEHRKCFPPSRSSAKRKNKIKYQAILPFAIQYVRKRTTRYKGWEVQYAIRKWKRRRQQAGGVPENNDDPSSAVINTEGDVGSSTITGYPISGTRISCNASAHFLNSVEPIAVCGTPLPECTDNIHPVPMIECKDLEQPRQLGAVPVDETSTEVLYSPWEPYLPIGDFRTPWPDASVVIDPFADLDSSGPFTLSCADRHDWAALSPFTEAAKPTNAGVTALEFCPDTSPSIRPVVSPYSSSEKLWDQSLAFMF
ncbi:hypothetical protein NMY22_g3590 [Coprinellus aureogranulatus]|nr:hypothetical protein NMY22_g3590 [Coprinellus aureogranulatus]